MTSLIRSGGYIAPIIRRRRKKSGTMTPVPTPYRGAGRQFLYMSDWWTNILVNATSEDPNLDDPTNVATLKRLASRYDVCAFVDPFWHDVGWKVRDRMRQYATEQGRDIVFLRYMGSIYVRWTDQAGDMSIVPAAGICTSTGTVQDASKILTTSAGVAIKSKGDGTSYIIDPTNQAARDVAVQNTIAKLDGWDGVFLDEIIANYAYMRGDTTQNDPDVPAGSLTYETAKRTLIRDITSAVVAQGKTVGGNVDPYTTVAGKVHWPTAICQDSPGFRYPFIEAMWCAGWDRAKMTTAHAEWGVMQDLISWASWAQTNGHEPVLNTYTLDDTTLKYGAALAVASGGRQAIVCGQAPNPSTDEYADEPKWFAEYEKVRPMWSPTNGAHSGASTITREYARGTVTADCTNGTGLFLAPGESAPNPNPTQPAGTVIFTEPFPGADGAAWPAQWASGMVLSGSTATIQGGRGQLKVGTSSPGVRTQRFTGSQFADFHALCTVTLGNVSQSLTMMFRSSDDTLDEDNAYGVRVWYDRLELITFDASWSGTVIATSTRSHAVGQTWRLRVTAAGNTIRANSWLVGDPEPSGWAINTTDTTHPGAGHFGWSIQGYGSAGAATAASIDDLTVATS